MILANLAFIGAGNMASSIIGGLVEKGVEPNRITATDPYQPSLDAIEQRFGVNVSQDNGQAAANADVVILAVKPQVLEEACHSLRGHLKHRPLMISIAAGIDIRSLEIWLGGPLPLVRCMPNTPALVQTGASGLFANTHTSETQKALAESILSAVGISVWLPQEALIDPVTAVSGSGPAYFFLLMEAMIEAGVAQGLDRETSAALTLQTALGAAKLASSSDVDVAELRRRVTSPKGTTEQAILSFEQQGFRTMVDAAMQACAERSKTMASELGAE